MALEHKFALVEYKQDLTFKDVSSEDSVVRLDDYFVQHYMELFQGIASHWNYLKKENKGLNYYGITFFGYHSIRKIIKILEGLELVFNELPEKFELRTEYNSEENVFIKTAFHKKDILFQIRNLSKLCNRALSEDRILVHFGI